MQKLNYAIVILFLSLFVSCEKNSEDQEINKPIEGTVRGKVTDTHGQPVSNATIVVNNTLYFNNNIVLTPDADGKYACTMPATDTWYVRGSIKVAYHGYDYELPLCPDFPGAFTGISGKEVNLQWKLTGKVPTDFGGAGYYGGTVVAQPGFDIFDLTGVELTLTPEDDLIDGSKGNTIVNTVENRSDGYVISDIPIGRYTITARLNGQTMLLRLRNNPWGDYVSSLTADFEPAYPGATSYVIPLDINSQPEQPVMTNKAENKVKENSGLYHNMQSSLSFGYSAF